MNNKLIFQLSFGSICIGTVMWFLLITNLVPGGLAGELILDFGISFGMILFAVGILQLHKSAQIPSIILITCSALNFIALNFFNLHINLPLIWTLIFSLLTFYFPIIFFLIFILKYNDVKQLKIKIFIAIFGVGFALVNFSAFHLLLYINPDLMYGEYGLTWLARGLTYLRFFGFCGGLLMAVGAFAFLSAKSPETIKDISQPMSKDISQPMSISDWLITYLIMIVPIVNIVMLFIWGFGSNTNLSKANWAKAILIWMVILFVLYGIILMVSL